MSNHLANYYANLLFIMLLAVGTVTTSLLSSFSEMLAMYEASYKFKILLCGFNGVMILALLKSWRCIDREIKRRLNHSPLNQAEKEWLEKNSTFLRHFKGTQSKTKHVCYSKTSRLQVHGLMTLVLFANIISLWLNL